MSDHYFDFVIDTNSYAGNFERELCKHVTGHDDQDECPQEDWIDDSEVSSELKWFAEHILFLPGGDGDATWDCPMELYLTPGSQKSSKRKELQNNSIGIHLDTRPPLPIIEYMKKQARSFEYDGISDFKILNFRLLEIQVTRTEVEVEV